MADVNKIIGEIRSRFNGKDFWDEDDDDLINEIKRLDPDIIREQIKPMLDYRGHPIMWDRSEAILYKRTTRTEHYRQLGIERKDIIHLAYAAGRPFCVACGDVGRYTDDTAEEEYKLIETSPNVVILGMSHGMFEMKSVLERTQAKALSIDFSNCRGLKLDLSNTQIENLELIDRRDWQNRGSSYSFKGRVSDSSGITMMVASGNLKLPKTIKKLIIDNNTNGQDYDSRWLPDVGFASIGGDSSDNEFITSTKEFSYVSDAIKSGIDDITDNQAVTIWHPLIEIVNSKLGSKSGIGRDWRMNRDTARYIMLGMEHVVYDSVNLDLPDLKIYSGPLELLNPDISNRLKFWQPTGGIFEINRRNGRLCPATIIHSYFKKIAVDRFPSLRGIIRGAMKIQGTKNSKCGKASIIESVDIDSRILYKEAFT
jgi:hypothetical protein